MLVEHQLNLPELSCLMLTQPCEVNIITHLCHGCENFKKCSCPQNLQVIPRSFFILETVLLSTKFSLFNLFVIFFNYLQVREKASTHYFQFQPGPVLAVVGKGKSIYHLSMSISRFRCFSPSLSLYLCVSASQINKTKKL